uniref:Transmembrane protein 126A n=1 Tax=Marmota marmota marmota TaxID=9994 RepID=A0A8C5YZT8_MARMA
MENHKPHDTIKEKSIFDIIARKIELLPEAERNLLEHGSTYIGLNAALCGLIANSLFRCVLHVTKARIAASLPMAVLPFLTKGNTLTYWIKISKPIFRKMLFPILLQTMFAAYLGSRQYKVLIKALQLPEPGLEIH